ncbi:hypothetical protein [Runella sp.]|uniref:hypothetical protein n=1 Tax=Runella sp. TaxID=1960881 RepID=UPI003D14174D
MQLHFTPVRSQAIFCFLWIMSAAMLQAQTTSAKPHLFHIHLETFLQGCAIVVHGAAQETLN